MPTFATPQPIAITVDVVLGDVRIVASDRADTVVEVRPSDPAKADDVRAAKSTKVDFGAGELTVKAPRGWDVYTPFGGKPSIDVTIDVPTGSDLHGIGSVARFHTSGELGRVWLKTSVGDMRLDRTGPVELKTSGGNISIDSVAGADGQSTISTSTGLVRIRSIEGSAIIKNANGDSTVRELTGELRASAANGNIAVERVRGAVTAKTANGSIRVTDATSGTLRLEASMGEVEVAIHPGSAAWLDVNAKYGFVENLMDAATEPAADADRVQVYARNNFGNVIVRQAIAA